MKQPPFQSSMRRIVTRNFTWNGGERSGDGRFTYGFDEKGRLVTAVETISTPPQPILLRERFDYDGNNRLVVRRVEQAILSGGAPPKESDWTLAGNELLSDGLPAEVTFVWDPVSDQLVEVWKAGASTNPATDDRGLLRQIIHGGLQYDDPIEVTEVDSSSLSTQPIHIYPVYDEAGADTLQIVLGAKGNVLSRHVISDPYGAEESSLEGAAVDRVEVKATKDNSGTVTSVEIRMRLTEQVTAASIATGIRLAAVDPSGAVVRSTTAAPQLFDNYTLGWTLTSAQWESLTNTTSAPSPVPVALSIAATNSLRSLTFGAASTILPAPDWATVTRPTYTSNALPVEVREQLATLSSWLSSIPNGSNATNTLYEIQDLALAGTPGPSNTSRLLVMSPFHAHPYADPVTGLSYVRERWLDPGTGTWLSPDPLGYKDSSNLYAFAGADPVNHRDPTGECWNVFDDRCRQDVAWTAGSFVDITGYQVAHPMLQVMAGLLSDNPKQIAAGYSEQAVGIAVGYGLGKGLQVGAGALATRYPALTNPIRAAADQRSERAAAVALTAPSFQMDVTVRGHDTCTARQNCACRIRAREQHPRRSFGTPKTASARHRCT